MLFLSLCSYAHRPVLQRLFFFLPGNIGFADAMTIMIRWNTRFLIQKYEPAILLNMHLIEHIALNETMHIVPIV